MDSSTSGPEPAIALDGPITVWPKGARFHTCIAGSRELLAPATRNTCQQTTVVGTPNTVSCAPRSEVFALRVGQLFKADSFHDFLRKSFGTAFCFGGALWG
jgi:hypothetical protein